MDSRELVGLLAGCRSSDGVIVSEQKSRYLTDYQQCRTVAKGCQILHCDECKRNAVVYNPCNRRGCPVCAHKNQLAWLDAAKRRLIPVGHIHLVFSFPTEVTDQWRKNPRQTVGMLFRSVNRVLREFECQRGVTTGRMLVFQSHGRGLSYKAHVHCLMTDGGLNEQDDWVGLGVLPLGRMVKRLEKSVRSVSSGASGWRIHHSQHELGGDRVVGYLGQRQIGMLVKPEHVLINGDSAEISDHGIQTRMGVHTFVQRYLDHVPEKGTVMVRHYGLYSNRKRELHALALSVLQIQDTDEAIVPFEPQCPKCKVALMVTSVWAPNQPKNFEPWGFETHPPGHWEYGRAG